MNTDYRLSFVDRDQYVGPHATARQVYGHVYIVVAIVVLIFIVGLVAELNGWIRG